MSLFYSGNISNYLTDVNDFRFHNQKYNLLYEAAVKELDENKRNQLFVQCDQMIVDQAPVMPILSDDYLVMVNIRIRDFKTNAMENLDFSTIFIKEPKK